MENKHFKDILDYGIFRTEEMKITEIPTDVDWDKFKYYAKVKTKDEKVIIFRSPYSGIKPSEGDLGFLDGERIMDGKYPLASGDWMLLFEKGFLSKWLRIEYFQDKIKNINFKVETTFPNGVQIGDLVFVDGKAASDGKYTTGRFGDYDVVDGKVVEENKNKFYEARVSKPFLLTFYISAILFLLSGFYYLLNISQSTFPLIFDIYIIAIYIGLGALIIFNLINYKIRIEKDFIIIGGRLKSHLIKREDVLGVYPYPSYNIITSDYNIVIVKKDGSQDIVKHALFGKSIQVIYRNLLKRYPKISLRDRKKYIPKIKLGRHTGISIIENIQILGMTCFGIIICFIDLEKTNFLIALGIIPFAIILFYTFLIIDHKRENNLE